MRKNVLYRYNPETDNFERLFPSIWERIRGVLLFGGCSVVVGGVLFLVVFYGCGSPTEKALREENAMLRQQYKVMDRRLENALGVMKEIENRDDNFYRVLMQMDPLSETRRIAGLTNEDRYRELRELPDGELVRLLARRLDLFERQLYAQTQSFDEIKAEAEKSGDRLAHVPSVMPLSDGKNTLSGGFGIRKDPLSGKRKFHSGHDFSAPVGTAVYSSADGKVAKASREGGYGNCVEIDHGYNYITRYAHLSEISVEEGAMVKRGEMIGRVGNTGSSVGPHLHYEVRFRGEPQNPVNFYFNELTPAEYSEMSQMSENAAMVMD